MKAYIKAEFFRIIKRPGTWKLLLFLFILTTPMLTWFPAMSLFKAAGTRSAMPPSAASMFFGIAPFWVLAFTKSCITDEYKFHTFKNTLAMGLSRKKVYVSKLITSAALTFGTFLTILLVYLAIGHLFCGISGSSLFFKTYAGLLGQMASSIPLLMAAVCVSGIFACLFNHFIPSMICYLSFLVLPYPLLQFIYYLTGAQWIRALYYLPLITPFHKVLLNQPVEIEGLFGVIQTQSDNFYIVITPEIFMYSLILGVIYISISIPIGLYIFKRKDIC